MWLSLVLAVVLGAAPAQFDASTLTFSAPTLVTEIEPQNKAEPRRLAWAPDGSQLYVQLVSGKPPSEQLRHVLVNLADGKMQAVEAEPAWAQQYWVIKQDVHAPGDPALMLAVEQREETVKSGPGPSGVLDRSGSPDALAGAGPSPDNLAAGQHGNSRVRVVRLSFVGQEIASWVGVAKPVPGMAFGWGPEGSGALVYATEKGGLVVLDRKKRHASVQGAADALLPAWSADGQRLAWLARRGKDRYALLWSRVGQ